MRSSGGTLRMLSSKSAAIALHLLCMSVVALSGQMTGKAQDWPARNGSNELGMTTSARGASTNTLLAFSNPGFSSHG
eukprot:11165816-Lingulodinium_polyedra.AAC.1